MTEDLAEMIEELDFLEAICDHNVSFRLEEAVASSSGDSSSVSECEADLGLENELNTLIRRTISAAASAKPEQTSAEEDSARKKSILEESHHLRVMICEGESLKRGDTFS